MDKELNNSTTPIAADNSATTNETVKDVIAQETITNVSEANSNKEVAVNIKECMLESTPKNMETVHANTDLQIPEQNTQDTDMTSDITPAETTKQAEAITSADQYQNITSDKTAVVIESNILLTAASSSAQCETVNADVASVDCSAATALKAPSTGLALLAQYDSDCESDVLNADEESAKESDTHSIVEIKPSINDYRTQVVEVDSESSSDSSLSETENKNTKYLTKLRKKIEKCIDADDDDDEDDDDSVSGKIRRRQPPTVKGELTLEDLPPIQDLQISVPEEECIEFGRVHSIVDQLLLVSALPNSILLDLDTVLFLEKGKRVLGEVFDVLGQVADPLYCVRFNNNEHIQKKGINVGDVVYVAPKTEYTQYVILSSLMKLRGSDASWENDIEPPPRYIDYSDDEQEREARQQLRKKNRTSVEDSDDDPTKRARTQSVSDQSEVEFVSQAAPSQREYAGNRRGRGSGYHQRPPRYGNTHGYQPQNMGSWHAYYNQSHRNSAGYNNRGFNPAMHRMPRPIYNGPPRQYNPYAPPMPYMLPQRPPPLTYVVNPFAFRPPALPPHKISDVVPNEMPTATLPPPPPPPSSQTGPEPEPPAPGSTN